MILAPLSFSKFGIGWLPALAVATVADPAPRLADAFLVTIAGIALPPITCLLGLLGVFLARPLARKQEGKFGWPTFLLVSLIMLIVVELWIVESRPSALFAFVVAIGLGFSGYSLIELVGTEIRAFISNIVSRASAAVGIGSSADAKPKDSDHA